MYPSLLLSACLSDSVSLSTGLSLCLPICASLPVPLSLFRCLLVSMSVCPSVSFLLSASLFVHTTPLFRFRVHFLPIPDIINLACPCFQKPILTAYLGARLSPQEACVLLWLKGGSVSNTRLNTRNLTASTH